VLERLNLTLNTSGKMLQAIETRVQYRAIVRLSEAFTKTEGPHTNAIQRYLENQTESILDGEDSDDEVHWILWHLQNWLFFRMLYVLCSLLDIE
jgi:hypothetical protein